MSELKMFAEIEFRRGEDEKIMTVQIPNEAISDAVAEENSSDEIKDMLLSVAGPIVHSFKRLEVGDKMFIDGEWSCEITKEDIIKMDENPIESNKVNPDDLDPEERAKIEQNLFKMQSPEEKFEHFMEWLSTLPADEQATHLKSLPKEAREFILQFVEVKREEGDSDEEYAEECAKLEEWKKDIIDAEEVSSDEDSSSSS